jgi:NTP pyrophosphatase (non-canonical NTP hydrolase)
MAMTACRFWAAYDKESAVDKTEDQISITAWGEETFGPATGPDVLVARALVEMDELLEVVRAGDLAAAALETADVFILLYRVASLCGFDVQDAVDRKMQINRKRRWRRTGDGTGSHIKD